MKYSIRRKIVAFVLAAFALAVSLCSGFTGAVMYETGIYSDSEEAGREAHYKSYADSLAMAIAQSYAAHSLSGFTAEELRYVGWGRQWDTNIRWRDLYSNQYCYRISDCEGNILQSNYDSSYKESKSYSLTFEVEYPFKVTVHDQWQVSYNMYDEGEARALYICYKVSPVYSVTVWFGPDCVRDHAGVSLDLYSALIPYRYPVLVVAGIGLLLAVACLVYLFCGAGKKFAGDKPMPRGINKVPLDLYGVCTAAVCGYAAFAAEQILEEFVRYGTGIHWSWPALAALCIFVAALCIAGFLVALAAQWKMHGFYVWHNSIFGRFCNRLWLVLRIVWRKLCIVFELLPTHWKYLLLGLVLVLIPLRFFYLTSVWGSNGELLLFLFCLCCGAVITYGAYANDTVRKGARRMASGELNTKIDTKYLAGAYKKCAEDVNTLADVTMVAAKKQIQSERMKTELITNVSHDIKTPLTSIINYIDLMQKAETAEQSGEYLQVLDRQSQRLKKLIDDLMEMSKAASGNMPVDVDRVNGVEAVNQALGEFADKLTAQELTVVFAHPDDPVFMQADGRLTWRVLSNLLSNIVKYALPGTRVYVDICKNRGQVEISLKNISREALNVSAQELTERFVRGDASRNTEGSGLGLNIAKSLMELQKGSLKLFVEGDLFKVTVTFPAS